MVNEVSSTHGSLHFWCKIYIGIGPIAANYEQNI